MGGFRKVLRQIFAAMRAATAGLGQLARGAFHVVDDTAEWVARVMRSLAEGRGAPVDDEVLDALDADHEAAGLDDLEAARRTVGGYARRAAAERLEHGVVVSGDIPGPIRAWVSVLSREALRTLVANYDVAVGQHVAGEHAICDNIGHPLRRPDPAADEAIYRQRLAERERRERVYDAAVMGADVRPTARSAPALAV